MASNLIEVPYNTRGEVWAYVPSQTVGVVVHRSATSILYKWVILREWVRGSRVIYRPC